MKTKITYISDTHTKHYLCTSDLPGGDILVHAGDIMNSGYHDRDITDFCNWFSGLDNYKHKIFIAGNHDRYFENHPEDVAEILAEYPNITYLQDSSIVINGLVIYGSPWQPEFCNWAFNLPIAGKELESKWSDIPENTDLLITHGPPQGILDTSGAPYNEPNLGCALLRVRVDLIKPKMHVFGHIHGSAGYEFNNGTYFFNASILNERYEYWNAPYSAIIDSETNEIEIKTYETI
jgi:Icc-related predicted phosphoesterase